MEGTHMGPVNASVRLACEVAALYGVGAGTWAASGSVVATAAVPAATATTWAVFRVPDDPGPAPFAVPGAVRLALETLVLGGGAVGLVVAHGPVAGAALVVAVAGQYATAPARLRHLLSWRGWGSG